MNAAKLAIVTLKDASHHRDFWYLIGSFFVCGLSTSGLIGTHFIPAAHDHGMMEVAAASLLALVGVFDVIGTIFSGWLTDRYDPRKLLFIYYLSRGLSLFLLPHILFSSIHPSTLVFVIFYGLIGWQLFHRRSCSVAQFSAPLAALLSTVGSSQHTKSVDRLQR